MRGSGRAGGQAGERASERGSKRGSKAGPVKNAAASHLSVRRSDNTYEIGMSDDVKYGYYLSLTRALTCVRPLRERERTSKH